jgi:hypothetical protein
MMMSPLGADDSGRGAALDLSFLYGVADARISASGGANGTAVNSAGNLAAASAPRFDYDPITLAAKGLLVEEARTNSIRNSTMQGAIAASPGTVPINWGASTTANGLTRTIVGAGVESGIPCIDVQFSGTPSSSFSIFARPEGLASIAASSGQTWTSSAYLRLVAGDFTNISVATFGNLATNGATQTEVNSTSILGVTGAPLITQRISLPITLVNASTTNLLPQIVWAVTLNNPINFTVRIGLPHLEQATFADSVIQTTAAAVTRAADGLSMTGSNFSSWFNATQGTFYAEFDLEGLSSGANNSGVWEVNDGTTNNVFRVLVNASGLVVARVFSGGAAQATLTSVASVTTNTTVKVAFAYAASDFAMSVNGATAVTAAAGSLPVSVNQLTIGDVASGQKLNGHMRALSFYASRRANATLQAMST